MPVRHELTPATAALLVVDMENDWVEEGGSCAMRQARDMAPRLALLIDSCRRAGVLVAYSRHVFDPDGNDAGVMRKTFSGMFDAAGRPIAIVKGTHGSEVYELLKPRANDIVFEKRRANAFIGTQFEKLLRTRGIETLLITGVATNGCCEATARYASDRDFNVIFVADCTATCDLPDLGWGPITGEQAQNYTLTTLAFALADVCDSNEIIARLANRVKSG